MSSYHTTTSMIKYLSKLQTFFGTLIVFPKRIQKNDILIKTYYAYVNWVLFNLFFPTRNTQWS